AEAPGHEQAASQSGHAEEQPRPVTRPAARRGGSAPPVGQQADRRKRPPTRGGAWCAGGGSRNSSLSRGSPRSEDITAGSTQPGCRGGTPTSLYDRGRGGSAVAVQSRHGTAILTSVG